MVKRKSNMGMVLIIVIALLLIGMYLNTTSIGLFTTYSTSRTCISWLENQGLPINTQTPFNWQYTSSQTRCVTSMIDDGGCKIQYVQGSCSVPTTPSPPPSTTIPPTTTTGGDTSGTGTSGSSANEAGVTYSTSFSLSGWWLFGIAAVIVAVILLKK